MNQVKDFIEYIINAIKIWVANKLDVNKKK